MGVFKLIVEMHGCTDFSAFRFSPEKAITGIVAWILNSKVLVAERDGDIVGVLIASTRDSWFSEDRFISEELVYVVKRARGGRTAYMLMREFINWARGSGARHVRAGVSTGVGATAERLYQHFGMTHTGGNFSLHLGESQCAAATPQTILG